MIDQREFDGRANFAADDSIEGMLDAHFERYGMSPLESVSNFPIYARRVQLKRFLAHYELFCQTIELPGDILELGVYRGHTLMSWANFLEIRNMGDRQKQVFGFDNFAGFKSLDPEDGKPDPKVNKVDGGFDASQFEEMLEDAVGIYDKDRFIPYKPRVVLVKGDIEETLPQFIEDTSGLRLSVIHFDCDVYKPTKLALELLWPRLVKGGVCIFDEYAIRPWEGESKAVDEYFEDKDVRIQKFDWCPNPGGFIIK